VKGRLAVGIDIGGTKIAAALVGRSGLIGTVSAVPTNAPLTGPVVLERAIELARETVAASVASPGAIGVSAGGWIDRARGRVIGATALLPGWSGLEIADAVQSRLGLPAILLNDGHAMGIAEARLGAGRGHRVCLSVAIGTGIGGAITINGQLLTGAGGFGGAAGHVPCRLDGPVCSCGRRGCIEANASGPAMSRAFERCVARRLGLDSLPDSAGSRTLEGVVRGLAASEGARHQCAESIVATAGSRLGRVLGGLANVLDPNVIIVGGGAAAAIGEPLLAAIRAAISQTLLPHLTVEVAAAELGPSAAVVGAGLSALDFANAT
jgi:glucokinase